MKSRADQLQVQNAEERTRARRLRSSQHGEIPVGERYTRRLIPDLSPQLLLLHSGPVGDLLLLVGGRLLLRRDLLLSRSLLLPGEHLKPALFSSVRRVAVAVALRGR